MSQKTNEPPQRPQTRPSAPRPKTNTAFIKKKASVRPRPATPPSPAAASSAAVRPTQKKVRVVLRKRPVDSGGQDTQKPSATHTVRSDQTIRLRGGRAEERTAPISLFQPGEAAPRDRDRNRRRRTPDNRDYRNKEREKNFASKKKEYNYRDFIKNRKQGGHADQQDWRSSTPITTAPIANPVPKSVAVTEGVTVGELARKMNIKGSQLVSKLLALGIMAGINEKIDTDTTILVASEYGCTVRFVSLYDETELPELVDEKLCMAGRPPVVTVMGHVDHGKTTLLDTIRNANVTASESGGITQHIAAYQVENKGQLITFIDTPGHAAFTRMRSRGAQITDIVVLVVAADDGLMPQTKEAIDHAKEAKVPIIVAINKVDLEASNVEQAKRQLSDYGLVPEEWGGDTIFCAISALNGTGLPDLMDAILVNAAELGLQVPTNGRVEGRILESRIDHGRGVVCTILIQKGTLKNGDSFLAGIYFGKVRALFDDTGARIESAGPSKPVEVLGFNEIPDAGDPFQVASSEKEARAIGSRRQELKKIESAQGIKKIDIDSIYSSIEQQAQDVYKIIVKGDVAGSVEAIKTGIERLKSDAIKLEVIRAAVGDINSTDVLLASASNAMIVGFHVRPSASIQRLADQERVAIRRYTVIYKVLEDIEERLIGMQKPQYEEVEIGAGEVRTIFSISKIGTIAGSFVIKGKVKRNCIIELFRDNKPIHRGQISGLKRFKDDVKEVDAGYECGITIDDFNQIETGDTFKVLEAQKQE